MVNVFKSKDTVLKYVLLGLKIIVFGLAFTIALSFIFGFKYLKIVSESMTPKYKVGDIVIVDTHFNYNKLKVGDVITYKAGSANVTHRIVDFKVTNGVKEPLTQGDANSSLDTVGSISKDRFVGKVVMGVPKLGTMLEKIAKPSNYIILVVALILILFITIM